MKNDFEAALYALCIPLCKSPIRHRITVCIKNSTAFESIHINCHKLSISSECALSDVAFVFWFGYKITARWWLMTQYHISYIMVMIRYSTQIITTEMCKLKTHSPIYGIKDIWQSWLNLTHTRERISLTSIIYMLPQINLHNDDYTIV